MHSTETNQKYNPNPLRKQNDKLAVTESEESDSKVQGNEVQKAFRKAVPGQYDRTFCKPLRLLDGSDATNPAIMPRNIRDLYQFKL